MGKPGFIRLTGKNGQVYEISYRLAHDFELGTMYIGNKVVAFLVSNAHRELFNNAQKIINSFPYGSNDMRVEVSRYLPRILSTFESRDNRLVMILEKSADLILLRDALNFYQGKIPCRHVAWIQSTLHNLACYLDYAGLSHNAISVDTYFISPQLHSGALLGGWWYAVPQRSKLIGVPVSTYSLMPLRIKNEKCGSIFTDLESIRAIGRELLGDRNGTKLAGMNVAPSPMVDWLRNATSEGTLADYANWKEVLTKSFGPRKFVSMDLTADKVYPVAQEK